MPMTFYNISIRSRLILYFLFLILLPTLLISATIYHRSSAIINQNIKQSVGKNLAVAGVNLQQKFETINDVSTSIYMNPDMIDTLSAEHPGDSLHLISELATLNKLMEEFDVPSIGRSSILPKLYLLYRPEYLQYNFSNKITSITEIETESWYTKLPLKSDYTVVGLAENKAFASGRSIKIAKKLYGLNHIEIPYVALLTVDIDIKVFDRILSELRPTKNSDIYILDQQGTVAVHPGEEKPGDPLPHLLFNQITEKHTEKDASGSFTEDGYLFSYKKMDSLGWTIVSQSPVGEMNGELNAFNRIMLFIIVLCVILGLIMALFLANNISSPIQKFVRSLSHLKEGNFSIPVQYKRKDEFAYLFSQYNKMIARVGELIQKLYITEVMKKEAELKALQAQINPHFLYNTLDSINWIALKHNVQEISTMVTSLSDFFRYNLSKGNNMIPLEDELKQVQSYLSIQQVRFHEKLEYRLAVSPDVLQGYTVKLILQPIVENAILHGIEKRRGKGIILLDACLVDGTVRVTVSDNGVGADPEQLNRLLNEPHPESSKSYGIRNVHQRIKQVYGDNYGLTFEANEEGPGLKVTVRFPFIAKMEEIQYAHDDHSG